MSSSVVKKVVSVPLTSTGIKLLFMVTTYMCVLCTGLKDSPTQDTCRSEAKKHSPHHDLPGDSNYTLTFNTLALKR